MSTIVQHFHDGLAAGKLNIQRCNACGKLMLYPRYRCIDCHSDDLGWVEASGKGKLHSFTVVRAIPPTGFEDELPYGLGIVKLEEGVQLMGRLVPDAKTGDWSTYACDVEVRFCEQPAGVGKNRPVAWFQRI